MTRFAEDVARTRLLPARDHVHAVAARLGNADPVVTLRVSSQLPLSTQRFEAGDRAGARLAEILAGAAAT